MNQTENLNKTYQSVEVKQDNLDDVALVAQSESQRSLIVKVSKVVSIFLVLLFAVSKFVSGMKGNHHDGTVSSLSKLGYFDIDWNEVYSRHDYRSFDMLWTAEMFNSEDGELTCSMETNGDVLGDYEKDKWGYAYPGASLGTIDVDNSLIKDRMENVVGRFFEDGSVIDAEENFVGFVQGNGVWDKKGYRGSVSIGRRSLNPSPVNVNYDFPYFFKDRKKWYGPGAALLLLC